MPSAATLRITCTARAAHQPARVERRHGRQARVAFLHQLRQVEVGDLQSGGQTHTNRLGTRGVARCLCSLPHQTAAAHAPAENTNTKKLNQPPEVTVQTLAFAHQCASTMRLGDLISLWTTPRRCRYSRPVAESSACTSGERMLQSHHTAQELSQCYSAYMRSLPFAACVCKATSAGCPAAILKAVHQMQLHSGS